MQSISYAFGKNHWQLDPDLRNILAQYWNELPVYDNELSEFGRIAGGQAYELADYVDRSAQPQLIQHDIDGNRIDRVRLAPSHRELLKQIAHINRPPYEGGSWHHHFAYGYLLADTGLYCSLIVTNQTAYAIYKYAPEHSQWLERLLTGQFWGATWMTETQGGSDLGANRTQARSGVSGWHLFGNDKFFASNAGLADLAIVTARPDGAADGPKGIALFLVPRLDRQGGLNFQIRRLKQKSATRAVPTGEIEFNGEFNAGSEAYLVGKPNEGIYYTLENLTVSRLANAAGAMGLARKAHLEVLYRVISRSAFGSPLAAHPLIRYDLLDLAVRIAAGVSLVFRAVDAFDQAWQSRPPYSSEYHYARLLSHLVKNSTADHSAHCTRLAMELFGGIGFLEDFAISRLHRESLVTAIWEGSSNIQALDMLEVIRKKGSHESLLDEFIPLFDAVGTSEARVARNTIETSLAKLEGMSPEVAQWYAKDILNQLANAAQVGLLYRLAEKAGERYALLARLYAQHFLNKDPYPDWALEKRELWWPIELT